MSRPISQPQEDLIESQARTLALARERRAEAERWEQAEAERRQDEAQAQATIGPAEGFIRVCGLVHWSAQLGSAAIHWTHHMELELTAPPT